MSLPKSKKRAAEGDQAPRKRRKNTTRQQQEDEDLDVAAGLNRAFQRMDGQLLADHFAQRTGRFGTDLSSVELADLYISANAIRDTSSWQKPRATEHLPEFLEAFSADPKELGRAPKEKGSPHTIVVTAAGLRAANLVRSVRKFQTKDSTIAKLFAKHIKIEESISLLEKSRISIGVGTPARLMDLLDHGALSAKSLKRIVVDASHIDQKKRGVMDMKDTMMPLAKFLSRKELKERYADDAEQHIDLMFY